MQDVYSRPETLEEIVAIESLSMAIYASEKRSKDPVWSLATTAVRNEYRAKATSMVAECMKVV